MPDYITAFWPYKIEIRELEEIVQPAMPEKQIRQTSPAVPPVQLCLPQKLRLTARRKR